MTTLTDFLLARIAEDEAIAKAAAWFDRGALAPTPVWTYAGDEVEPGVTCDHEGLSPAVNPEEGAHIALHDPARVFAECEAKRRIVGMTRGILSDWEIINDPGYDPTYPGVLPQEPRRRDVTRFEWVLATRMLEALAQVYADHPDYQPEWSTND